MSEQPMQFPSWWEDLERSQRRFDQNFRFSLNFDDVMRPSRRGLQRCQRYERAVNYKNSGVSTVQADKNKFQVTLDVQQFSLEEITVKVVGNNVVVEGKHEEGQDEHRFISRQFVDMYILPEQCDIDQLKSSLSSDGVLMITVPRVEIPQAKNERIIKIQTTGQPALRDDPKPVEKQKEIQKNTVPQRGQEQ